MVKTRLTPHKTVNAKSVKGFVASTSDQVVILTFSTEIGDKHFAVHGLEIPHVISRLMAAHAEVAKKADQLPTAIVVGGTTIAVDLPTKMVTLSMMPSPEAHIPFAMSVSLTEKTIAGLSEAVASLRPPQPNKPH